MSSTVMGPIDTSVVLPDAPELSERLNRVNEGLPPLEQLPSENDTIIWVANRKKELGT